MGGIAWRWRLGVSTDAPKTRATSAPSIQDAWGLVADPRPRTFELLPINRLRQHLQLQMDVKSAYLSVRAGERERERERQRERERERERR